MTSEPTSSDPGRIAVSVLGLGPMGAALAAAFIQAGHPTTVWNRTAARTVALERSGATAARTVDHAVAAGDVIVACLRGYDAVGETLARSRGSWRDRLLVNLTSGTPAQARQLADELGGRGIAYLEGVILTPTPTIGTPAASVLYSGSASAFAQGRPALAALRGSATYVGDDPGRANAFEVALLDLFATSVYGLVHAYALGRGEGIAATELAPYAAGMGTLLPEMAQRFADNLSRAQHPGERFSIASAETGIRHIISAAAGHGIDTGALSAMQRLIHEAAEEGHEQDGLSRLSELL